MRQQQFLSYVLYVVFCVLNQFSRSLLLWFGSILHINWSGVAWITELGDWLAYLSSQGSFYSVVHKVFFPLFIFPVSCGFLWKVYNTAALKTTNMPGDHTIRGRSGFEASDSPRKGSFFFPNFDCFPWAAC